MESASSKEESSSIVAEELRFRKITKVAKKKEVSSSRVFKMFNEGISPMNVVVQTDADPAIIQEWFRRWVEMNEDWRWWREREPKVVEQKIVQLKTGELREAWAKSLIKGLEVEAKNKLEALGSDEAIKLQGKKPSGLIAGMIYVLAKERGLSGVVTQTLLAETYGITPQTAMKNVKLLKELMQNPVARHNF